MECGQVSLRFHANFSPEDEYERQKTGFINDALEYVHFIASPYIGNRDG
jgi:hypothetical protein